MRNHTFELMRSAGIRRLRLTSLAAIVLLSCNLITYGQDDQLQIMPARGVHPAHSYAMSDIETVNTTSGNLMLDIPLASLPPGRGGHPGFQLRLRYNSKIWDGKADVAQNPSNPAQSVNVVWLQLSDEGGWRYNIPKRYYWVVDNRNDHGVIYPPSDPRHTHIRKMRLMFPDGSSREMRPYGYDDGWDDGYFAVQPAAGMSYYSTDGSFLRLDIGSSGAWTLNFPDGSQVVNQSNNTQRTYDRLGNFIEAQVVTNYNGTGHSADVITDQLGRSIIIEHNTNEDYIYATGFNGATITTTVKWVNTHVSKVYRAGNHFQFDTNLNRAIKVVSEILLPVQLGAGLKYTFGYNGNTASGMGTSVGWGELSSITLPSSAKSDYQYFMDNKSGSGWPTDMVLENSPTRKDLNYDLEYDGATVAAPTETWIYTLGDGSSKVIAPDGGITREWFTSSPNRGRVYKTQNSDGSVVESIWQQNRPYLPPGVTIANVAVVNAFVSDEFLSIPDATGTLVLTAMKHYTYDKNGNVTQIKEYDWVPYSNVARDALGKPTGIPANAPLKRVTTNTYYSETPDSSNTATNDPDSYDKASAPRLLNLGKSVELGNGTQTISRTELTYDNPLTTGNLTEQRSWDSTKGANTNPLTSLNSITISHQYDTYGNRTISTDARGFQTKLIYGTVATFTDLYPTQVITAFGTSLQRTENREYDFSTGLVKKTTDADNNVSNETDFDVFGRVTETRMAANVQSAKMVTRVEYSNINRRVVTRSDLNTAYDGKLVKIQHYDELGRIRLTRELENAADSATDETKGIKVQTRYFINNPCLPTNTETCLNTNVAVLARFQIVSNPYRAATSSAASGEATMGWSRSKSDVAGRVVEGQSYAGATLPAPWAANGSSTGVTTTAYNGIYTTSTDPAGKVKRHVIDGLGRTIRVDEPAPDSNNLGSPTAPLQAIEYEYDVFNNLITVTHGQQVRSFEYTSLSRLKSSINPETSNLQDVPVATAYDYDNNGNLKTKTDPRGVTITYDYDALNRLTARDYSDTTPDVTLSYDDGDVDYSKGRLTSVSCSVSTYSYQEYDALGRPLSVTQTTDGVDYDIAYTYNLAGSVTSQTYPSGKIVVSDYDGTGRLTGVKNQATLAYYAGAAPGDNNSITYAVHGAVDKLRLGNGLWEHTNYNSRLQITEIGIGTTSANSSVLQLSYSYGSTNNNGNLQSQTITVPTIGGVTGHTAVQSYTYDELNRLATAQENSGASWVQNYDYDRYGNRNFVSGTTFPAQLNAANNPTFKTINNRINQAASGQSNAAYDNAGNLTQDVDGNDFTYDGDNKQVTYNGGAAAGGATYFYDGDGRRVKKVAGVAAVTTVFVYDVDGRVIAEYATGGSTTNGTRYVSSDYLGSPRLITDANQQPKERHDYLPFGEEIPNTLGGRSADQKYGVSDSLRNKFSSKERDSENGLDYFGARYYNSVHGRFTSADEFWKDSQVGDPQSWNKYIYVRNNPLRYVDPEGEKAKVTITTDLDKKTGTVVVTASFAVYSPNGDISRDELQQHADELKKQIETAFTGSFSEDGISYSVSAEVTVNVMSAQDAETQGARGQVDNLVSVVNTDKMQFLGTDNKLTEATAYFYRNQGEKFDRMTIAAKSELKIGKVFAHEFGHVTPHLGPGNLMQPGQFSRPSTIQQDDFKAIFGPSIKSHMSTRKGAFASFLSGKYIPCSKHCAPHNPSKHEIRAYYVAP